MTMKDETGAPAPSTAIARVHQNSGDDFRLALEPGTFNAALEFGAMVASTGMCGIKQPAEAMIRLMVGRALGIPAAIALQHVYDVEGRPSISAKLKVTLCMRHPECEYFEHVSSDQNQATYKAKRRGKDEQKVTFKIEDAQRAGLLTRADGTKKDGGNWFKWPRRMLQARASSELADIVFPDATMGMSSREELEDERDQPGELRGEVVEPKAPPQAAKPRDWQTEMDAVKQRVVDAKTPEEKKAVRAEVGKFADEAGEPWGKELKAFYSMTHGAPPKPATAPAPAAKPKAEYLPPNQRGDSYEGPNEPPPPFGGP